MRAAFYTFGCKLNQSETEALASAFRSRGFSITTADQIADLYIINTCTVTSKSEQKARGLIRRLGRDHPLALLLVTGCYAQLNEAEIVALADNVRVLPQADKDGLLDFPKYFLENTGDGIGRDLLRIYDIFSKQVASAVKDPFRLQAQHYSYHSRPYVKIQDGCDNSCAYCRVPLARGRSVSLAAGIIVERIQALADAGYGEIVLTGVNISAYRSAGLVLPDLIEKILIDSRSVRFRLSSLEPDQINRRWIHVLENPRICAHYHLPVQSGADPVLTRMRRRYRAEDVSKAIDILRQAQPRAFIAGDIIVGFPGETEANYRDTYSLVAKLEFSQLHVFPFSPRPGTAALALPDKVPERIRDRRVAELLDLSREAHHRYIRGWEGEVVTAVLERPPAMREEAWTGLSDNYIKLRVSGVPVDLAQPGRLVSVKIVKSGDPAHGICIGPIEL